MSTGGDEEKIELLEAPKQRQIDLEMRYETSEIFDLRSNVGEGDDRRVGGRGQKHRELVHKIARRDRGTSRAKIELGGKELFLNGQSITKVSDLVVFGLEVIMLLVGQDKIEN